MELAITIVLMVMGLILIERAAVSRNHANKTWLIELVVECPSGMAARQTDHTGCIRCSDGTETPNGVYCTACKTGYAGIGKSCYSSMLSKSSAGYVLLGGICSACPSGSSSLTHSALYSSSFPLS